MDGGACGNTQQGCTNCNGDQSPWCVTAENDCPTVQFSDNAPNVGWTYCNEESNIGLDPCACKASWASTEDCGDMTLYGCSGCDGTPDGWCVVTNPGCETERTSETGVKWTYCDKETGVASEDVLRSGEECGCAGKWYSPMDGGECYKIQNGCTNCNEDPGGAWCKTSNPGCKSEQFTAGSDIGWAYCDIPLTTAECKCKESWVSFEDGCSKPEQGCSKCEYDDDDDGTWYAAPASSARAPSLPRAVHRVTRLTCWHCRCMVENPGCATDESPGNPRRAWSYCNTTSTGSSKKGPEGWVISVLVILSLGIVAALGFVCFMVSGRAPCPGHLAP